MKQENKDKTLSSIVALITIALVVYLVFQSGVVDVQGGKTLKDLFSKRHGGFGRDRHAG